jgi:hypothetical protein
LPRLSSPEDDAAHHSVHCVGRPENQFSKEKVQIQVFRANELHSSIAIAPAWLGWCCRSVTRTHELMSANHLVYCACSSCAIKTPSFHAYLTMHCWRRCPTVGPGGNGAAALYCVHIKRALLPTRHAVARMQHRPVTLSSIVYRGQAATCHHCPMSATVGHSQQCLLVCCACQSKCADKRYQVVPPCM